MYAIRLLHPLSGFVMASGYECCEPLRFIWDLYGYSFSINMRNLLPLSPRQVLCQYKVRHTPLRSRHFSKKKNFVRKFGNYGLSCNYQKLSMLQEKLKKYPFLW